MICGLMTGCNIYFPQVVDLPMLEQQGDLRLDASADIFVVGGRATATYAVTNHFGIQASGILSTLGWASQGAAGFYTTRGHQIYEIYAGFSGGESSRSGIFNMRTWGDFNTYFLQADYGWTRLANNHIDLGFGLKSGYIEGTYWVQRDDNLPNHYPQSSLFIEPTLTFRVGWQHLKFTLGAGLSFMPISNQLGLEEMISISIGINYFFNLK